MAQMKPHHLIQFDSALILRPNKTENGYRKLMYQSPEIILFHNPLYYSLSFQLKIFILQILQLGGTSNRMRHEISLSKELLRVLLHRDLSQLRKKAKTRLFKSAWQCFIYRISVIFCLMYKSVWVPPFNPTFHLRTPVF